MSGNLFIVSAPSGAGKTSLVAALLDADPQVRKSVSITTRAPRPGEVDGREYKFVGADAFERMRAQGEFVESALVHGNHYGTSHQWIGARLAEGRDILLEIDWQGAAQVRKMIPDSIGIFILPPSIEALISRLNKRAQDTPDVISRRIAAARTEISHVNEFKYVIINDNFAEAVLDLTSIVRAWRLLAERQLARNGDLIKRMT